ncbi:hypothetical protein PR003_g24978 [Phytophthora rubi]|uniref:Protein kinase domain-containing protein n=1 Tax=Phytophthora rubi TaxID=129364 RepID=A0A6A4CJM4_9STRA|nr:hypothetical protein PR001_g25005 [Phytophthora rubi]KAE9291653.1 hypothetical protein PR003_g24978 [Phytophthora rubi]
MAPTIVSIMNRHTGMVLEQNSVDNSIQALDSGLDESTHQWFRIPVGSGYFAYKNVATGKVLDHWDAKEGPGNTVAMSDDVNDPNHHWFETKLGDIFIGLRNRTSRLFIDHYGSREIRTSGEDCSYVERHWCLIWHHPPTDTGDEIVTLRNFESGKFLEHNDSIQAVASRVTSTLHHWQRLPVGIDGYFAYKNVATGMGLSLSQQGVEAYDDDITSATHQWRECDVGGGLIALQNRAFVCMLRQTDEEAIHALNISIQGGNDLWKIERAQPVDLLENKPKQDVDVLKNFRLDEDPSYGNDEDFRRDGPVWIIQPEEVVRHENPFAAGSFGSVYRAKWSHIDVVVKEIEVTSGKEKKRFLKEVKLWSELRHDNIVPFYGASLCQDKFFIVSKLAENGTLPSYLKSVKGVAWRMMLQVAAGLQYLHDHKIIHGDLKGNNIVVSKNGTAMLTDFGFSFLDSGSCSVMKMRDQLGALQWRAPEFVMNTAERPTFASDVYSLGMCIIAAVNGTEYPWGDFDSAAVRDCLRKREIRVEKPAGMTTNQWQFVKQMIAFETCDRPLLQNVLEELERFAFDEEYDEKSHVTEENNNNANTSRGEAKGVMGIVEKSWSWISSMAKP